MGRYLDLDGESDFKFWFGSQPSDDILEFGTQNDGISGTIYFDELERIEKEHNNRIIEFNKKFNITFDEFMKKIEDKGYLTSSDDPETSTDKWKKMSRDASLIDLGNHIITKLKDKKDSISFYAEC